VTEMDRELEFFILKDTIDAAIVKIQKLSTAEYSCETWAMNILQELDLIYPSILQVSVYEDNENGAIVCK
jgi:hypothetical protein